MVQCKLYERPEIEKPCLHSIKKLLEFSFEYFLPYTSYGVSYPSKGIMLKITVLCSTRDNNKNLHQFLCL
uniref:Uncharacterized protein n=1 Tax=Rhizophora mucronata TaxID=61149 RepID=A0A2P2NMC5_RHIMU